MWRSTVCAGLAAKRKPSINRSSSAISLGLLSRPPLWTLSSLCINSAKFSMSSSRAGRRHYRRQPREKADQKRKLRERSVRGIIPNLTSAVCWRESLTCKSPVGLSAVIVCRAAFPQPPLPKASDPGGARCVGHPCAVHTLPWSLHHRWGKARIISVSG